MIIVRGKRWCEAGKTHEGNRTKQNERKRSEMDKQYRHEWKHAISKSDMLTIRQRMRTIARPDPHAVNGRYLIRSLYLDNLNDKALREKIDGVNRREKWRIRYYNLDPDSVIHDTAGIFLAYLIN